VHGKADLACKKRLVDLFGEKALAAEVAQRLVLNPISARGDNPEVHRPTVQPVGLMQPVAHMGRLPQGKRAATGADENRCRQGGTP